MDQESFADVLAGMESGYMLFPRAMHCCPEVCLCGIAFCLPHTLLYVPVQQVIGLCIIAVAYAYM